MIKKKVTKKKSRRKGLTDSPARWKRIKQVYGLSKEDYLKILSDQNGMCFICLRKPEQIRRKQHLSVEHRHSDGIIRGLLCGFCNREILPRVKEDPEFVKRLLIYLTRETDYGKVPEY